MFKGGSLKDIKKEAGKIFDKTVTNKKGDDLKKARENLIGPYTSEAALRRELDDLKGRGYKTEVKGKGADVWMQLADGKAGK